MIFSQPSIHLPDHLNDDIIIIFIRADFFPVVHPFAWYSDDFNDDFDGSQVSIHFPGDVDDDYDDDDDDDGDDGDDDDLVQ